MAVCKAGRSWRLVDDIRALKSGGAEKDEPSSTSTSQGAAAPAVAQEIEKNAAAFEAHIGYTPERIVSTVHPWGWMYGWRDTQDAFRKFCNRGKSNSGAAPVDALDAAQSKPDFSKCASYGDYFVALRKWEEATGLVSKAGAIAASTSK